MNTFKSTKLVVSLIAGLALTATSINAEPLKQDTSLTQIVITQGKAVASELTEQLSQSIANELKSFSIDSSLLFTEESMTELALESKKESQKENKQSSKNKPLTKIAE
jgi:hypothetical protein